MKKKKTPNPVKQQRETHARRKAKSQNENPKKPVTGGLANEMGMD